MILSEVTLVSELFESVFFGVLQRLDARDLGRSTRYCDLVNNYHTWDGGTDHRASPSVPAYSVHSRPGRAPLSKRH